MINHFNYEISQFFTKVEKKKVKQVNQNDLVIIWIGSNDLVAYGWIEPINIYDDMSRLYLGVDNLVQAGARNFIIFNIPDLGITPEAKGMKQDKRDKLILATNKFNEQIALATKSMAEYYAPHGVKILPYDVKALLNDAITHPEDYGITNTTDPCYTGIMGGVVPQIAANSIQNERIKKLAKNWNVSEEQLIDFAKNNAVFSGSFALGQKNMQSDQLSDISVNGFNPKSCKGHLFFDRLHPTTEVHYILSNEMVTFINQNWQYQA